MKRKILESTITNSKCDGKCSNHFQTVVLLFLFCSQKNAQSENIHSGNVHLENAESESRHYDLLILRVNTFEL